MAQSATVSLIRSKGFLAACSVAAMQCAAAPALAQGITDLGTLNGAPDSTAYGISADGSVLVGSSGTNIRNYKESGGTAPNGPGGVGNRAVRWTAASNSVTDLGTLNGGNSSFANGVSADGAVIVGFADDGPGGPKKAVRWTAGTGFVSLGTINNGSESYATAASTNGSVVVGAARDGNAADFYRAFRWTQSTGLVSLGVLNGGTT